MLLRSQIRRRSDGGYIMLMLTLTMALMVIFAAVIVPTITFEIKRDREEEMIHRGTQYSRAIRAFYKKFGRYPGKMEDLDNTGGFRFLRRHYKDPESCKNGTCKDFVLLHYGDAALTLGGLGGGGSIPGAAPIGGPPGNALFGANSNTPSNPARATVADGPATDEPQTNSENTSDAAGANGDSNAAQNSNSTSNANGNINGALGNNSAGATFGGGAIVGVTSANKKDKTIREFNHKKKYSEWQFIYDPATDRGSLIKGPNQPQVQAFGQQAVPNLNGQQPGSNSPFSSGPSSSGMQNSPNSPSGGFGQNPPPTNPPQQQ